MNDNEEVLHIPGWNLAKCHIHDIRWAGSYPSAKIQPTELNKFVARSFHYTIKGDRKIIVFVSTLNPALRRNINRF